MKRIFICIAMLLSLAACSPKSPYADDASVARAVYSPGPPNSITLFTVLSNRNNSGAHTGLLINASQRVMFDPAGTWRHPRIPERNDVHYGMTDKMVNFYIDYHARETYRVIEQTIYVTAEQAEIALQRAQSYGAVPKTQCARSVSNILRGVPGFENMPATLFPKKLMNAFGSLPGVTERTIRDEDADKNYGVLLVQAGEGATDSP
ncbi:MAG: hypothetical protein DI533_12255 [Cereibacter sphaeroides]|uniref:Lipoprotein n=1 Tax=Cereibacter sphaeroides TaxID=1063 RepID=A0A2W5TQ35_CERSP|nr:MAG: hypothetical protein DI533_12255 [Cereibacter sphaeroides]